MQNNLNLEQMYSVRVVNGYCLVAFGNVVLNEKIVADGFAVVNKNGVDSALLEKLHTLQNLAQERRVGLWNSFYDEMECFKEAH